jgi:hypothetical protein
MLPMLNLPISSSSGSSLIKAHAALSPRAREDLITAVQELHKDNISANDHSNLLTELQRDYQARHGITPAARAAFNKALLEMGANTLHHGDCVGADATAHTVALEMGLRIVIHPPTYDIHRAFCLGPPTTTTHLPPLAYIARNRKIVDAVDLLVALPYGYEQEVRSGTWSTYRYARGIGRQGRKIPIPTLIIYPDGSQKYERGSTLSF